MNSDSETNSTNPTLGPFSATCVVVGAIVGIGIFFTPKDVAIATGSASLALAAWAIGGFIAILGSLTFAELGSRYRRNGGQFEILRDAWSAPIGFAYVFCNATVVQAGAIAVIAYYSALNFGITIHGAPLGNTWIISIAATMIVGLTIANIVGIKWGAGIQNATVVAKVLTLLLITGLALFASGDAANGELASEFASSNDKDQHWILLIFAGLVHVFFSFGGWQHALWVGGEIKNPQRNIPLAIIAGIIVVTTVYMLVNWAYFHLLGFNGVAGSNVLAAQAVGMQWPNLGTRLAGAAIALSGFGVLNAQLLSGPRLISGMAREGKFFSIFNNVSARTGTPIPAIVALGLLGLTILLAVGDGKKIGQLVNGVVLVDSVFFLLTGLAIFRLRHSRTKKPNHSTGFQVPLYPIVPIVFVIGEILVMVGAFLLPDYRKGAWIGLVCIAVALVVYAIFFRDRQPAAESEE